MKVKIIKEKRTYRVKILKENAKEKSTKERYFGNIVTQLRKNPELAVDSRWILTNPAVGKSLGSGYSRVVYSIPENKNLVIKFARGGQIKDGSFTNAQEIKYFNKYPDFFPRVYESDKTNWERQSVMLPSKRADNPGGTSGTAVKESPHALWLVVDKVIPINDQAEYWKFIHKNFPQLVEAAGLLAKSSGEVGPGKFSMAPNKGLMALWEIMMGSSWTDGDTSRNNPEEAVSAIAQLILEEKHWALRKALSFEDKYGNAPDANVMSSSDKEWFLKRQDILKAAEEIYNAVGKDIKLANLMKLCDEARIDSNDIRHGNIGTDIATKTKFILLDIGIFLNDYLVNAPAVDPNKPPPL